MDQRRADAVMDLFRRVADGNELPWMRPAATGRSGSCCTPTPSSATAPPRTRPASCAVSAPPPRSTRTPRPCWPEAEIEAGAAARVLLVDGDGVLQRTLRLPKAPPGGWTRDLLTGQVRAALPDLPDLQTESYEPTVAITDHVRAVHPRCTSYDCARLASRCDLDHDESWPRGPTCVTNLCPRCRRHHELKTRGLVRTRLHPDGPSPPHPARHHRHHPPRTRARLRSRRGLRHPPLSLTRHSSAMWPPRVPRARPGAD